MSKETIQASDCACGMRIQFMEYHLPHCPVAPASAKAKKPSGGMGIGSVLLSTLQTKMSPK